jgi:hypothetical protein
LFAEFIFREQTTRSVLLAPERDGRWPKAPKNLKKRLRASIASGWKFRRRRRDVLDLRSKCGSDWPVPERIERIVEDQGRLRENMKALPGSAETSIRMNKRRTSRLRRSFRIPETRQ